MPSLSTPLRAAVAGSALALLTCIGTVAVTSSAGATTPKAASTRAAKTIRAVETEYHIALSKTTVAAGRYTITAVNRGTIEHGLVVNGPGVHDKLIGIVQPGQSASKAVTLHKGRYDIFCPISNHKMRGMNTHLTVH